MIQNSANERTTKGCYQTGTRLRSKHPTDRNADRNQYFCHLQELGRNKRTVPLFTDREVDRNQFFCHLQELGRNKRTVPLLPPLLPRG